MSYERLGSGTSAAHVHNGAVGVAGPVFVPFSPVAATTAGIISGVFTLSAAQKDFIVTGASYFNVHTSKDSMGTPADGGVTCTSVTP